MKKFLNIKDASDIHLRQGELDGACTVYSLMMGLIIAVKGVTKTKLINLDTDSDTDWRTSYGRLIKEFFYKMPQTKDDPETTLIRNGATLAQIQDKLSHSFSKVIRSYYGSSELGANEEGYMDKYQLLDFIAGEIDEGCPVEIAFRYRRGGGGHAVLAVGYEKLDGALTKVFCLDPGIDFKGRGRYNAVIDLTHNGKRIQYHEQYNCTVEITEALSFEKQS